MRKDIFDIKKRVDKKIVIYVEADLKYITTYWRVKYKKE